MKKRTDSLITAKKQSPTKLNKINLLSKQINKLSQEYFLQNQQRAQYQSAQTQDNQELIHLKNDLIQSMEKNKQLVQQIELLQQGIEQLQTEIEHIQNHYETKNNQLQNQIEKLQKDIDLFTQNEQLAQQIENLQKEQEIKNNTQINQLNTQIIKFQSDLQIKDSYNLSIIKSLEISNNELEYKNQEIKLKDRQILQLELQLDSFQSSLDRQEEIFTLNRNLDYKVQQKYMLMCLENERLCNVLKQRNLEIEQFNERCKQGDKAYQKLQQQQQLGICHRCQASQAANIKLAEQLKMLVNENKILNNLIKKR